MSTISIRPATLEDLSILLEFEQGIIQAERPYDTTLQDGHINYYDLKALVESSEAEVVVAVAEGRPIGSGYVKIVEAKPYLKFERYGYIGFMFVEPAFRGQGVSQLILDGLADWARDQGLTEVRLEVYDENEKAVRAYQKAGFTSNLLEMRLGL